MHRAVVLMLMLQGVEARHLRRVVWQRATQPMEDLRVPLRVETLGQPPLDAVWLFSEGRSHVAFLGPLGRAQTILRADRGVLGLEVVGEGELLALDAGLALSLLSGLSLSDLGRLVLGRLPENAGPLTSHPDGWSVAGEDFEVRLDPQGEVRWAHVDGFVLTRDGPNVRIAHALGELDLQLGEVERAPVPDRAFALDAGRVPSVSLERTLGLLEAGGSVRW